MIPQNIIDDIRRQADIVDIVSDYVRLKPSGKNFKALSPFTSEKTPSFVVSPDKQLYKCFSSGKGGNVFSFIMEMEKVPFPEAVELVAKHTGIDIRRFTEKKRQISAEENARSDLLQWAAKLFHRTLLSENGKKGLAYLAEQRGLSHETIASFGLGYATESWDHLFSEAKRADLPVRQLAELGLVSENRQKNNWYDTFRNRVIFPILSIGGQVVGFGGRTLQNDPATPKYLNSPESQAFEKSKLLYGLHAARQSIRKMESAILVEGYMDVLALHQAGVTNAIASCGTALTRYQANILRRHTSKVLFMYDADPAGRKSMMSGIDVLVAEGVSPSVVLLPPGDDPDSFVKREKREGFQRYIDKNQLSFIDFQIGFFTDRGDFGTPDAKTMAVKAIAETVLLIPDRIRRELYFQELSEKLSVSREALQELSSRESRRNRFRKPERSRFPERQRNASHTTPFEEVNVLEKTFLKALLESTRYGNTVLEFAASHEEMLELRHPAAQEILSHMIRCYRELINSPDERIDVTTQISMFSSPEARNLASGLLFDQPISSRWLKQDDAEREHARRCLTAFLDAFRNIITEPLIRRKQKVTEALQREGDNGTVIALQREIIELNTIIKKTSRDLGAMIAGILESR